MEISVPVLVAIVLTVAIVVAALLASGAIVNNSAKPPPKLLDDSKVAATESYEILLKDSTGTIIRATVDVCIRERREEERWRCDCTVRINWPHGNVESTAFSVYHAFASAREQMEPIGLVPQCFGACPEVQVTGMAVEATHGIFAYRLTDPTDRCSGPTVNIFHSAPDISPASVAEQRTWRSRGR